MSFTIEKAKTSFELDSAHYLSTLGYSWDVILKFSYSNLELISVIEIHQFIESTLRGFISMTFQDYAEASTEFSKSYYPKKPTSYIIYLDANDSYEYPKIKLLPTQIPDRANPKDFSLNNYSKDSSLGYFL